MSREEVISRFLLVVERIPAMLSHETSEMLSMSRVIEAAKDAVERFENGELNVREAIALIREAEAQARAA